MGKGTVKNLRKKIIIRSRTKRFLLYSIVSDKIN